MDKNLTFWLRNILKKIGGVDTKSDDPVYILKQIAASIDDSMVHPTQVAANQTLPDGSNPSALKNLKVGDTSYVIPETIIVEGTVDDDAFTEGSSQPSLADAVAVIAAGGVVYLKYTSSDKAILEMAVACDADTPSIATKNLTWSATADDDEER